MGLIIKHKNGLYFCGDRRWSNLKSEAVVFDSPNELPGYIGSNGEELELCLSCLHPTRAEYFAGLLETNPAAHVEEVA